MKQLLSLALAFVCLQHVFAQTNDAQSFDANNNPPANATHCQHSIEAYAMPVLFSVQLSNDSLMPPKYRNQSRIGDAINSVMQYGRLFGKHILQSNVAYGKLIDWCLIQ